jgi:hypothetical protein
MGVLNRRYSLFTPIVIRFRRKLDNRFLWARGKVGTTRENQNRDSEWTVIGHVVMEILHSNESWVFISWLIPQIVASIQVEERMR